MAKQISCGVLIVNERGELLLAHATGQKFWDLPKGVADAGEAPADAAVRECLEETGVALAPSQLKDLGVFKYLPAKNLHLFLARVSSQEVDPAACRCTTFFTDRFGRERPEVDGFRWAGLEEVGALCTARMGGVLLGARSLWAPSDAPPRRSG